jgi:hypothetical protein
MKVKRAAIFVLVVYRETFLVPGKWAEKLFIK